MKRTLAYILLTVLAFPLAAQYRDVSLSDLHSSELAAEMKTQIQTLSSAALEGRKAGSEGEAEAARFIAEEFQRYGIDLLPDGQFGIKQANGDTLVSHNVVGFVTGSDSRLSERYIVVAARLDNLGTSELTVNGEKKTSIYYGANGNASGLSMMLQLAKMINTNNLMVRRTVVFAALGASLEGGAGAWYLLNRSFPDVSKIDAMVNLDMLGTGSSGFYAYSASNKDLNAMIRSLEQTLQPVYPTIVSMEPVSSDHRLFYDKEIPAVFFTTGMYPEYNSSRDTESIIEYDMLERELEYIFNFTVHLANSEAPQFRPSELTVKKQRRQKDVVPYYECDTKPSFLGSSDPIFFLKKWVYVYLRYPKEAVRDGVQGSVPVSFIIDERGKVCDVKVVKSVDPLLDEEAVRVISASPDWKPGRVDGKKVKSEMTLYVDFKLERKK